MAKCFMLSRLGNAVKKVKFLLNTNLHRCRIASTIGASSGKRRLSFKDRSGLRAYTDDSAVSFSSYQSEDDIDKRAEMFIANFRKQLRIERQVSLNLRHCRTNSFE
ncbi:DUF761 domain-containing protein [Melia azedarach]|uniref:DUF761 domain-containing protein n=1 Tax=Melia azedarach TaxID=155640 RepID=A0ACC1XG78_MELAZ|nr:DUF761 domain-containing protein [Melia azedarach]